MAQTGGQSTLPEWLDEKLVAASLRKAGCGDDLQVESVAVGSADPSGGGFHSDVLRVAARVLRGDGRAEQWSLIVKSLGRAGPIADGVRVGGMFHRETLFYTEVLPTASAALKAAEGAHWRPMVPSCYHSGSQPAEFLVLEDLLEAGFKVAENGKLLDREHCSLVVRCLARLHASSLLVADHESFAGSTFKIHPLYLEGADVFFRTYTHKTFAALAENLGRHVGYEKYAAKYRNLSANVYDRVRDTVASSTPVLAVLLHADMWKNNLMFKYSGDRVTDVRIIDFQNCFWGSPAFDLQHFLYGSASEDVHRQHLDELVSEYHGVLQTTLRALGFREQAGRYPLAQLWQDIGQLAVHGVCMSVVVPSIVLAAQGLPEDAGETIGDVSTADEYFQRCTSSPKFISHIKFLAPVLEKKGAL